MKLFLYIFVSMCVVFSGLVEGYDSHSHHSSKKGNHHKGSRDRKTHSVKQKLLFPSGVSHYISSPQWGTIKDCPGKPTFVTLTSSKYKWKREYEIVKNELENVRGNSGSFGGFKNIKIEKVFNSCLWYKYKYRKGQVYDEAHTANEKMLFHASSAPFVSARKGLDERYTTLEQGEFGAGLYFSDNSYKTHNYTKLRDDGTRVIMLCRVTLGKVHEKVKGAHAPVGFQSVSSSDGTTTEYSIYRGEQAYPDYVITYKD